MVCSLCHNYSVSADEMNKTQSITIKLATLNQPTSKISRLLDD